MKRILIILDEQDYKIIKEVKQFNKHTWEQCLRSYADTYKKE